MKKIDIENAIDVIKLDKKWGKKWLEMYSQACNYYKEHGNLLVPALYKKEENGDLINLGSWIRNQRRFHQLNRMIPEKAKLLELIGMVWDYHEVKWREIYECAKTYFEEHGNLYIPADYKVKQEGETICLGTWVQTQRTVHKNGELSPEREKKLENIGMRWNTTNDKWVDMYKQARKYYNQNNNLIVPRSYSVVEGKEPMRLGVWVSNQRVYYKKGVLSQDKIELLESIGMCWDVKFDQWMSIYKELEKYYQEHQNINIPEDYTCGDEKEKMIQLRKWLEDQRKIKELKPTSTSKRKIELLDALGMTWSQEEKPKEFIKTTR